MVKSFCKDCPNRHTICHDTCPQYQKYKQELKAENAYNQAVVGCYDSTYKCWTILEYGHSTARPIPTENVRCWMPKPKPPRKRKPAKANGGADSETENKV